MSALSDRLRGTTSRPAVAGSTAGTDYTASSNLPSRRGGVFRPSAGGGVAAPASDVRPGSMNINLLDPEQTVEEGKDAISSLFNGLRQATVGTNIDREAEGFEDKSLIGGVPILGNVGRGVANLIGGAGEVFGGALAVTGGALDRLPSGGLVGNNAFDQRRTDEEYNSPEVQRWLDEEDPENPGQTRRVALTGDKGLLGTGLFSNEDHFKSLTLRKFAEDQQFERPSLDPGAFTAPGSLSDQIMNFFDLMNVSADATASAYSQLDTEGGMDRIDMILKVGDGDMSFAKDMGLLGTGIFSGDPSVDLNPLEQLVYTKLSNGDWTRQEAADFLASNGQAFGHSAIANILGMVIADPLNVATLGAGVIAKVGRTGAKIAKSAEAIDATVVKANDALKAAQQARKYLRRPDRIKLANKNIAAARKELKAAEQAAEEFKKYASTGDGISKINPIARAAEGSEKVQSAFKMIGKQYSKLEKVNSLGVVERTTLGRAAKLTRTIIDPLHALDLRMPGAARAVDLYSDAIPASVANTAGVHHYKAILDESMRIDPTGQLMNSIVEDFAVASSNLGREGIIDMFRASQIDAGLGEALMTFVKEDGRLVLPDDMFETAVKATKQRDLEGWLRAQTVKHVVQETWTKLDKQTLARSLENTYGLRSETEWMKYFETASKETMSMLKFANYGAQNRGLLNFIANVTPEVAARLPVPAERMVLLARGTLSRVGADSLLTELTRLKSAKKKATVIRAWQDQYPALRYVSLDPANLPKSVDSFVEYLSEHIDSFPMQMTDAEFKALGSDAERLQSILGTYSVGFRPEERFLWGLARDNGTGLYRPVGMAWAGHVAGGANSAMGFVPARALRTNIMGHPIVGVKGLDKAAKLVDNIDSAARIMKLQVTGSMIQEAARKRFIARATSSELADQGVTERVANDWFDRITEYSREHQGYSGPRGYGGDDLYTAIREKGLIPRPLLNGERRLNPDDVMRLVLEAYDGDMRYIGLTQKLSGRAKRYLFEMTGSNFAGQIAEHAWPTLKFRYNPIFQLQEKIEPLVLSSQRGVKAALRSGDMTEADRATERLLQRMTDNSLVRQADLDQYEYSSEVMLGSRWRRTAARPGTALNRMQAAAKTITDVQGMKRLNMLRTFRKGLGKDVREAWDFARKGEFDQMLEHAQTKAGRMLSEDEFALQIVSENLYANDVLVTRLGDALEAGGMKADWANAIKTGAWHAPADLGELKSLDLEHLVRSLGLIGADGKDIKNLNELRQVLAVRPGAMDDVVDGLTRLGADKDYIRRVRNALDFSWGGFWRTAAKRFSLSADESAALQDMVAGAAQLRGVTPVEFMSQLFSPGIINGTEGLLGHLEGTVALVREARAAGRKITKKAAKWSEPRTILAGKEGVSTREDFVRQLSRTFSAHLDPSAKRALLLEFRPELAKAVRKGEVRLDLHEVQSLWDDLAENDLADRIIGYMDGKQPIHAFDEIDDAERGISAVRDAANRYMTERGVTPLGGRPHFKLNAEMEAHYEAGAKHYGELAPIEYERTGRIPTRASLNRSKVELKPKPDGVDDRTYEAYQNFVIDTLAQYDFMTKPKKQGGLGLEITVTRTDPYPDSAAMRADLAKGRLKVFGGNSDHPLMTNDQNVMFRAVHDVFGHGAEGFEFGPRGELNAAARHARMYSNEGRPAMLTETHGQTSYVNYSNDVYDPVGPRKALLDPADPAGDFERQHPFDPNESALAMMADPDFPRDQVTNTLTMFGRDATGRTITVDYQYSKTVGDGISLLSPEYQRAILRPIHDLMQEFPNLKIKHVDMISFRDPLDVIDVDTISGMGHIGRPASAVTWASDEGEAVIIFNKDYYGKFDGPNWQMDSDVLFEAKSGPLPYSARPFTPEYISRHEAGHAFDGMRRPRLKQADGSWATTPHPEHQQYADMMARFEANSANHDLSEYGLTNTQEFAGELFAFVTDPAYDAAKIERPILREMAEEFRQYLRDSGEWKPLADAVDTSRVIDNLPRPRFGDRYVFASDAGVRTDGDWGVGVYMSASAESAGASGGKVAAYSIMTDEVLDFAGIGLREPLRDAMQAMADEGVAWKAELIDEFIQDLGLTTYDTLADIQAIARKTPKKFQNTLLMQKYRAFTPNGNDIIIVDPDVTRVSKVADDVLSRVSNVGANALTDVPDHTRVYRGYSQKSGLTNATDDRYGRGVYTSSDPKVAREFAAGAGEKVGSILVPNSAILNVSGTSTDIGAFMFVDDLRAAGDVDTASRVESLLRSVGLKRNDEPTLGDLLDAVDDQPSVMGNNGFAAVKYGEGEQVVLLKDMKHARVEHANIDEPAAMTVREANAAKRGTVYAPQKAGLLPQEYLDEFNELFVGRGKHIESNPDVARTAQMFGKWTDAVITNGLLKRMDGKEGIHAGILSDIAGIPTTAAVPYNFTEAQSVHLATQAMQSRWKDAFRLQYFAQERSMLERSLNHPMFGLYPASYMWGKIMPEMVRFIGTEPFGNKTGGLLYSLMDAQAAIALRREQDPVFDAKIEELGHSQALSFGGYLLPAVPWDLGASAPPWMTSVAQQGLQQERAAESGRVIKEISTVDPVKQVFQKLAPLTTSAPWMGRAFEDITGKTEEEQLAEDRQIDKLVQASELSPFMERAAQELREALK